MTENEKQMVDGKLVKEKEEKGRLFDNRQIIFSKQIETSSVQILKKKSWGILNSHRGWKASAIKYLLPLREDKDVDLC